MRDKHCGGDGLYRAVESQDDRERSCIGADRPGVPAAAGPHRPGSRWRSEGLGGGIGEALYGGGNGDGSAQVGAGGDPDEAAATEELGEGGARR